jgi:putative transposase
MNPAQTITAKKLAKILHVATRSMQRRAVSEAWPYLNGDKKARRYVIAGLPEGIRIDLARLEQTGAPVEPAMPALDSIAPLSVGSAELADWQNKIALARADLIRAYLEAKRLAKSRSESITSASRLYIKGYNSGHLLPGVYAALGQVAQQTIETWVRMFREANHDYTALAPASGNRTGCRKVTDEEFNTLLSFALHPNRLNIAECTRLAKVALSKRGASSPSSVATLRRALCDFRNRHYDRWVFCREGEKALTDKVLPYIERDDAALSVGDVVVADGHRLNFSVLNPQTGKPCRMGMVLWMDWASRYPLGYEIMPTENITAVAASMRLAILALGKMPKVAYLDNGKAFRAKIFTDETIDFEEAGFYGMFARCGIETVFAWPYNAQSKPVERFFETFSEMEKLMPTYTGTDIEHKPAHLLRNEKLHKAVHDRQFGDWVPTIFEARKIIDGWLAEYINRPHRGISGLCPKVVLESGKGPGMDPKALRHLMMAIEIKTVHRMGISLFGQNFYDDALYGYRDRVLVRYDVCDLSSVLIYDASGSRLICEARPVRPVHPMARILGTADDRTQVTEAIEHKRALKKQTESFARKYAEQVPALIEPPTTDAGIMTPAPLPSKRLARLPRAEAEKIIADAAKMTLLTLKPKAYPVYMSEADRYEALLESECKGGGLPLEDMTFMRYFETTAIYRTLKERFEFLREYFIAGPLPASSEEAT